MQDFVIFQKQLQFSHHLLYNKEVLVFSKKYRIMLPKSHYGPVQYPDDEGQMYQTAL